MSTTHDDNTDAATYEMFVRRTFNCDRGDTRFPFADSNAWISLINKWNYANDPTRSKNSQGQRTKEYEVYFKTMQGYFDRTIEHVIKKHAGKEGREAMLKAFEQLQKDASKAKGNDDLRAILAKAISGLDEFGVVLK